MSGSVAGAGFSGAEVVDIRRWCGYPPRSRTVGPDVIGRACAALTEDEVVSIRSVFLEQLPVLEMAIPGASEDLGVDTAVGYRRNAREMVERDDLFRKWRLRLCYGLGVDPGGTLDLVLPGVFVV